MPVQGILLAAGLGARFDPSGQRDKLLEPLEDGRCVLAHAARTLTRALPGALAVIRPGQERRAQVLFQSDCRVLIANEAEAGMGAALAAAIRATPDADGWVVALGDMPCVPAEVISVVADAITRPDTLAAPFHRGKRGHPVGFGANWATPLQALTGDRGARDLLENAPIERIDCLHDGVLRDVDLPEDLVLINRPRA